jgi:hypothetical protein
MQQGQSNNQYASRRSNSSIIPTFAKGIMAAALCAVAGLHSSAAVAQCSPTNPDCRPPTQPQQGGGGGGGGVGVKVDVGSAAKAVGGLFKKKKKKPVEPKVQVATAPVEQPKREVVFVSNKPVIKSQPRKQAIVQPRVVQVRPVQKPRIVVPPRTVVAVRTPTRAPAVRNVVRNVAVPLAVATAVAVPAIEPEVIAETPLPVVEPTPAPATIQEAAPVAKAAVAVQPEAPKPSNNLYIMVAAAIAALGAAGAAAKFMFTPKVSMNCSIPEGSSHMVSNPSLSVPEVAFNVAIPGFAASTPDNLAIVA